MPGDRINPWVYRMTRSSVIWSGLALLLQGSPSYAQADDFYSICKSYRANQDSILHECFDRAKPWSYLWNGNKVELFSYVRKSPSRSHFSVGCVFQKSSKGRNIISYFGVYYAPDDTTFLNLDGSTVESVGHGGDIHVVRNGNSESLALINGFTVQEGPMQDQYNGPVWSNCEEGKYLKDARETVRPYNINHYVTRYRAEINGDRFSIAECGRRFDKNTNEPITLTFCEPLKYVRPLHDPLTYEIIYSDDSLFITRDGNVFFDQREIERACGSAGSNPLFRGVSAELCRAGKN